MSNYKLSRRHFITSSGTVLLLPLMESLYPLSKAMAALSNDPRRYVGIYFPNGTYNQKGDAVWYPPTGRLSANSLPPVLEPFTGYLNDFSVLKYLRNGAQQQQGGGGHVSADVTHFTCETIGDTKATTCQLQGSSFDQYVVAATKKQGIYLIPGSISGSYYPDAAGFPYGYPYMWFNNGKALEPTMNPVSLYRRILGQVVTVPAGGQPMPMPSQMPSPSPSPSQAPRPSPSPSQAPRPSPSPTQMPMPSSSPAPMQSPSPSPSPQQPRADYRKSILDSTITDIKDLQKKLGKADIAKLDDYLTSIREMELKIQNSPAPVPGSVQSVNSSGSVSSLTPGGGCVDPGAPSSSLDNDDVQGNNANYINRIKAMFDVVTFAFKCDLTRAVGMSFDGDGGERFIQGIPSNLLYQGADPSDINIHGLRHFAANSVGSGNPGNGRNKNISVDRLFLSLVFHLVDNLKVATDPSGSRILDNTIIDAGFSVVDGNHQDDRAEGVPCIVAGGGNFLKPGYAYDVQGADRGDMFYTYSTHLNLGISNFKGYTRVLAI